MAIADGKKLWSIDKRIDALRVAKLAATAEKRALIGSMDHDDWAQILPPEESREMVQSISGSGEAVTEIRIIGVVIESNHPTGSFFGPRLVGRNFGALLRAHPAYVDPMSSLGGAYMVNFYSYRKLGWDPQFDYSFLAEDHERYHLKHGIGAMQHFCQDLEIGLRLGFGGLLRKIAHYRTINTEAQDFYDGLDDIVTGLQDWISRTADRAQEMAVAEPNGQIRQNLVEIAEMNRRLVSEPPETFREACQWMVWYQMAARMFNGSGSMGRLDVLLTPYYDRETAAGTLTDDEAMFHIACLLLRDTAYLQVGGPDSSGKDVTNRVSYLVLEASHKLRIPINVGVAVGPQVDEGLLKRGVEIMFDDKKGVPKFLGVEQTAQGFAKNGYPLGLGYERAYAGCHWSGIPGREYTLMDCVKINLAAVFEVALTEMFEDATQPPSLDRLWALYQSHQQRAVDTIAKGLDFHLEHMHKVAPELVLDLCCHGPIEKGLDASHGGVEFYNMCIDASALATVADSFASIEQRIQEQKRMTWAELWKHLTTDWAGPDGKRARLMMKSVPHFGAGGSIGDAWADKVAESFTASVKLRPTPDGYNMIPGIFSWANTIPMGKEVGATPNGRRAFEPISHGASPDPGFRQDGAPSAMAKAVAAVQPGWGNTAPMQIDMDPGVSKDEGGLEKVCDLIKTHFRLGGTQINMNVMDADEVLEAHKDPSKYPDLIVRVTGFSAYFASLSQEFRQLVVDRIIEDA